MSSPGGETDDILRLGDKFYDEKLYSLAVEQYEKFLKVQPDHEKASHALFRLGHSYFFMGNFGRASEYFDTYLKRYPKDALVAAVLFKQAQSLFELKRYAEAAPCFARVFDEYTSSPSAQEALYRSGLSFYRDNAFDKAREQLTKFFDRYPKGPLAADALAALAGMALADGEKDNAIQYLQQCVSGFPGRTDLLPRIHYRLAAIYRDIDNKDLAIKEYQIALAAADTLAPGYGMLAEFSDYLYEKKLWGACADLTRRYIEKMAGQAAPAYYFRLPEAFFYAGQYRKAADEYDTFVLRYPDTSAVSLAKFTIAQCYVMLRQNETAIEYLEELAQRFANDRYGARAIRLMCVPQQPRTVTAWLSALPRSTKKNSGKTRTRSPSIRNSSRNTLSASFLTMHSSPSAAARRQREIIRLRLSPLTAWSRIIRPVLLRLRPVSVWSTYETTW